MREFLSWAQRHNRIDVTASTVERKTSELASAGPWICLTIVRTRVSERRARSVVTFGVKDVICLDETQLHVHIGARITVEAMHTHTRKTYRTDCGTYTDSVPREIYNTLEPRRSASSNRDEELANRVLKDMTITKRQLDLARKLMLEQVSRLSDGDYEQSAMI